MLRGLAVLAVVVAAIGCGAGPSAREPAASTGTAARSGGHHHRLSRAEYSRIDLPSGKQAIPAGRHTLVALVATYSAPDRRALPELARVSETYRARGLTVVLVFVDQDADAKEILAFARDAGAGALPIVHDRGFRITRELEASTSPSFFLLDAEGLVRHVFDGYDDGQLGPAFDEVVQGLF